MGPTAWNQSARRFAAVLGVAVVAGGAAAAATWATASPEPTPAVDQTPSATEGDPETHGFSAGVVDPTWFDTAAGPGYSWNAAYDAVATAPRTVYVTGMLSYDGATDLTLTKYVDGVDVWVKRYDGPAHADDWGSAIAARGTTIYTAGVRSSKSRGQDLVLIRWNRSGKRVWTRAYDSGGRLTDRAVDVAVDGRGNVTVVGTSASAAGGDDWVVVSYRPDGTRRYVQRYDGPAHKDDQPHRMLLDSSGRVYVVGFSSSANHGKDALFIKYSASGKRLWARRYDGLGHADDEARSLRARPGGGIYVAGYTTGANSGRDGLLLAYSAGGKRLFATIDPGNTPWTSDWQEFFDLEVVPGGRIMCGGSDTSAGSGFQQYLVSFDPATGAPDGWRAWRGGPYTDEIRLMAKDAQGGVYACGTWMTPGGERQTTTERMRFRGTSWESRWPAAPTGWENPVAIAVKGVNAYVVGVHSPSTHVEEQVILAYVY